MKTYFILFTLVLYCIVFTSVVYMLHVQKFDRWQISLMTHLPLLILSLVVYISEYWGINSNYDRQFQKIGKLLMVAFLIIYCLNSYGLIRGIERLLWFYGINLLGLSMILISSYRHGNFKN
jgi:hypothetical protein